MTTNSVLIWPHWPLRTTSSDSTRKYWESNEKLIGFGLWSLWELFLVNIVVYICYIGILENIQYVVWETKYVHIMQYPEFMTQDYQIAAAVHVLSSPPT
mmetsp:Transcript_444/g.1063  ORF Transcript_444/g.1063 Transcript_444/m.1063 type:complete len:99 (+) Transcript_444:1088-1384(+)